MLWSYILKLVILLPAAAFGSLLMTVAGKDAIGRLRPPVELAVPPYESSPSFPSGHSLNALVIAGIVAYLLVVRQHRKRTRTLTITLAVLFAVSMGLSRVYLGHHWLTDVLVAWTLGIAWLAVVITAHRSDEGLTVSVRDNGVGLPEGKVGSGLGTQIVRTLIEGELGGIIDWHTMSGRGTEVTIAVPFRFDKERT